VLSTFGVVFVAELPDKTALASLVLSTRYPVRHVIAGAWLAFLVQTAVAVAAGSLLTMLPVQPVRLAAGAGFLVFAIMAMRRKEEVELAQEETHVSHERRRRRIPWLASFLVVFAAEWGDLTQLATAALVAHTRQPLPVALGAIAALWSVTVLAAYAGSRLGRAFAPVVLNRVSAVLFAGIGTFMIVTTLA
jgi:putative Ca2+/H+ antiporter (TMEM165/GDT1 family)